MESELSMRYTWRLHLSRCFMASVNHNPALFPVCLGSFHILKVEQMEQVNHRLACLSVRATSLDRTSNYTNVFDSSVFYGVIT
jgi:hypothetical protein